MLLVFSFFAYFMKIFDRQNMLIFFKIFNHRWRWLACFHRFFGAQTNFFVNFIYKNPRKHLQNPWHSYHNFWQPKSRYRHKPDHLPPEHTTNFGNQIEEIGINQTICLIYSFTPWSSPWPPTTPPPCSWPWGGCETFENGSKWFPMAKNLGLEAKFKSLEDSEQNLQFHSLKSSLASYSPSTLFLTFRWAWVF